MVAALIVVVGADVALWWIMPGETPRAKEGKSQETDTRLKEIPPKIISREKAKEPHQSGRILQQTNAVMLMEASANSTDATGNGKTGKVKRTPTYASATEMILARIFSTNLGDPAPMVPTIPPRELREIEKIINRKTDIRPEDDEETIEMKRIGDLAKEEFRKFIEQGGDDSEFIDYYTTKLEHYHEQWKDAQRILVETAKEGDYNVTKALMEKINKELSAKGIKNVRLPPKFRKELEQLEGQGENE